MFLYFLYLVNFSSVPSFHNAENARLLGAGRSFLLGFDPIAIGVEVREILRVEAFLQTIADVVEKLFIQHCRSPRMRFEYSSSCSKRSILTMFFLGPSICSSSPPISSNRMNCFTRSGSFSLKAFASASAALRLWYDAIA